MCGILVLLGLAFWGSTNHSVYSFGYNTVLAASQHAKTGTGARQTINIILPISDYSEQKAFETAKKHALIAYLQHHGFYLYTPTSPITTRPDIKADEKKEDTENKSKEEKGADTHKKQQKTERPLSNEAQKLIDVLLQDKRTTISWAMKRQKLTRSAFYGTYIVKLNHKKIQTHIAAHQDLANLLINRQSMMTKDTHDVFLSDSQKRTQDHLSGRSDSLADTSTSTSDTINTASQKHNHNHDHDQDQDISIDALIEDLNKKVDFAATPTQKKQPTVLVIPHLQKNQTLSDQDIQDFTRFLYQKADNNNNKMSFTPVFMLYDLRDLLALKDILAFGFADEATLAKLQQRYQTHYILLLDVSHLGDQDMLSPYIHSRIFGSDLWMLDEYENDLYDHKNPDGFNQPHDRNSNNKHSHSPVYDAIFRHLTQHWSHFEQNLQSQDYEHADNIVMTDILVNTAENNDAMDRHAKNQQYNKQNQPHQQHASILENDSQQPNSIKRPLQTPPKSSLQGGASYKIIFSFDHMKDYFEFQRTAQAISKSIWGAKDESFALEGLLNKQATFWLHQKKINDWAARMKQKNYGIFYSEDGHMLIKKENPAHSQSVQPSQPDATPHAPESQAVTESQSNETTLKNGKAISADQKNKSAQPKTKKDE
jgi:hypothetical protein